jgi:formate dehydrogenase subunit delta
VNKHERLVDMANQISLFFESRPTEEEQVGGVAEHISRFWEVRMRKAIIEHLEAGGEGLRDNAKRAIQRLASPKQPA